MAKYEWLDEYLLGLSGCIKDFKEEWGWWRYRVCEKMFAATCEPDAKHKDYGGRILLTLKCEPMHGELLRDTYPDILPGFYMDKRCWISIDLNGDVPDELMKELCARSYHLVFQKLSKRQRSVLSQSKQQFPDNNRSEY